MMFKIKVMSEGDQVLNCWDDKIAIRRANGEVDIFQILIEENDFPRLSEHIWRITYGNNTIEITNKNHDKNLKKDAFISSENTTVPLNASEEDDEDFVISIRYPQKG